MDRRGFFQTGAKVMEFLSAYELMESPCLLHLRIFLEKVSTCLGTSSLLSTHLFKQPFLHNI